MSAELMPLDVRVMGTTVRMQFDSGITPEVAERVNIAWAGAKVEGADPGRTVDIVPNGDDELLLERLSVTVTLAALEQRRGEALMFHAAGVANDDGRVVAFVGPSGRGKTTLSRALCQHYGYVSDETIAVEADLAVHAYRKPLSVVRASLPKQQVSPAEAGMRDLPEAPLKLAALVLLERDADVDEPMLEPVAFADAVTELVPQMSYLSDMPSALQALAALCDSVGGVVRLHYAEAESVTTVIPTLLDRAPCEQTWEPACTSSDGHYSTRGVVDAVRADDGRVVVATSGAVYVLDGIAPAIWDAARGGADDAGVLARVVEEHGDPGDGAAQIVTSAIESLIDADILCRR